MRLLNNLLLCVLAISMGASPSAAACLQQQPSSTQQPAQQSDSATWTVSLLLPIRYANEKYGFCFSLPADWEGYTILLDEWHGFAPGPQGDVNVAQGPMITIRHPKWTQEEPRQDIPIMVFTQSQWRSVSQGGFLISAAPIGPQELAHNRNYVFALPPRYNYAFPEGYEQVNQIISSHPLHAPCRPR